MTDPGKLYGQKAAEVLHYLVDQRVIISMYLVDKQFERLTCINEVSDNPDAQYLLVDLPDGFKQAAPTADSVHLRFTFNGPDRLEYFFSTRGGSYSGKSLKVPFPEFVERIQRRKNFRMETPVGAQMLINLGKTKVILGLVNISMGGALGALLKHNVKNLQGSLFQVNQIVENAGIILPADSEREEQIIIIKKAEIRRVEHDKDRNIYRYAFEFKDLPPSEERKLTESIYHMQRMFLKKR